jgi:hypothetical protein
MIIRSISTSSIALLMTIGCTDRNEHRDPNRAILEQNRARTPDVQDEYEWSEVRLKRKIDLAQQGDVAAAKALYDYYGVWGDKKAVDHWEEWLVRRNDSEALLVRASKRFTQAKNLSDSDGHKLAKLKEADGLMRKWRAANARGDGLEIIFHQKIVAEIQRLNNSEASQ